MATDKKPFHETVAENLIEQLKAGTAPWQKPWEPGSQGFMPMNPTTGKRYKGINAIHLMAQGRSDNRWMTYKQASAAGAQVRKGEKGTPVQYWKFSEEQNKLDDNGKPVLDGQGKPVKETVMLERPRVFFATVFNGEQIDGMPPLEQKEKTQTWDAVERAEHILKASGANIRHGEHDRAFYRPSTDSIHLPDKEQFPTADNYYATALHELGHWTGHSSRLDRDMAHPFGSEGYAKEELKAECFSLIMGDELGIGHDPEQHAAYVGSWIKALQDDPLEIFRATSDAEKMSNYVLAFEQKLVQEQDQAQTQKLEAAPEQTQEAGMQLPTNNQQMRDQLLSALSQEDSQAINQVANERRRLAAGETDAQAFEETARQVLGFDLPADWNGAVQVQGNVVIEDGGEQFVEPAHAVGREPEFWGVYAQHENGMHQWVADLNSQNQADELANLLGLVDALSETNEHEQAAKLSRVNEVRVRLDPNSTDDDISAAKEARKTAEATATLNDSDMQRRIAEHERQQAQQVKGSQQAQAEPEKQERTYINVPYREKDEAKGLGARWDRQQQSWFVPPGVDTAPFAKWSQGAAQEATAQQRPQQEQGQTQTAGQQKQYLAVPYGERGAAKAAGAQWDKAAKSWYVGPKGDMERLSRWMPDNVKSQQGPAMSPREEFAEAMKSLGCVVSGDHPIMDGKKHRVSVEGDKKGERAGFYVGHLDGHPAGYISNNRTGVDMKWKSKGYSLDPAEKAKLQAEAAEKLAARAAELEQAQEATAERVSKQTANLMPVTEQTPYMQNKGIQPHPGVLTDAEGKKTYIPAHDENGKQWTMQYIQEDGTKRFAKDSRKEGCFHIVGGDMKSLEAAPALVLQEGYATAATNAEALGFATVAAFDSGNLPNVAKALHDKFPDKPVVILGDDDRHQELTQGTNPGKTKAQEAAKVVGGKAAFPVFAPGEAEYPAGVAPITPQSYREHLRASKALETAPEERKADLQKALLSKEQLAALDHMKKHTDFNDLATKSSLGREGVERQVRATVGKAVQEAERKREQKQAEQQVHKQKRSARIGY
ncbi:zincin-like metallopeptidase domain-containing protein [Vibrio parahaemolyticus]|uniref:zincin-like metallopeptidase domain-containing protein n=2 Tax=Vibrio parahaemolyticus TaxID=670 RepID=UPI00215BB093|nr:zincin-like metallopeptidase domain-containing protein [Vibrio parahaemolyticus]MCR9925525.1 zincin-like metallopeptidase domain-containing protein [Vibrio parahaemolyticus]